MFYLKDKADNVIMSETTIEPILDHCKKAFGAKDLFLIGTSITCENAQIRKHTATGKDEYFTFMAKITTDNDDKIPLAKNQFLRL